jgi:hypothetical protein
VTVDPAQQVPSGPQFRKLVEARRASPREKRKADRPSFRIHRIGMVLTLEFATKLDVRRITQLLLERGGRLA